MTTTVEFGDRDLPKAALLGLAIPVFLWRSFAVWKVAAWLLPQLALPYSGAMGVMLLFDTFRRRSGKPVTWFGAFEAICDPGFALLLGWLVSFFV